MKFYIAALVLSLSSIASAAGPYMMSCQGEDVKLNLQRTLKIRSTVNGWKQFLGKVDYKVGSKSGTLDAKISWRDDSRPGYNVLNIALMDKKEAEFRKQGFEGGSVGFGAIESREKILNSFDAKWTSYKNSEDVPELVFHREIELRCRMQN